MARAAPKPKELKPWERRPWPDKGDPDDEKLYAAIGRVLSEWERYDSTLSFLFASFGAPLDLRIGMRAYSSIRTFEGRTEMLRAASEAFFTTYPNPEFLASFKNILRGATTFSQRRNDIAHGTVETFRPPPPARHQLSGSYALFPSFASFRERDIDNIPTYCYTSAELEYFRQQFNALRAPVASLASDLITADRRRASLDRPPLQSHTATNPEPDQSDHQG